MGCAVKLAAFEGFVVSPDGPRNAFRLQSRVGRDIPDLVGFVCHDSRELKQDDDHDDILGGDYEPFCAAGRQQVSQGKTPSIRRVGGRAAGDSNAMKSGFAILTTG